MRSQRLYTHQCMPVNAQDREVLIRLGMYHDQDTIMLKKAQQALTGLMPGGCMRLVTMEVHENGVVLDGHEIKSVSLAKFFPDCDMALVMLSTLFEGMSERIRTAFDNNKADEAVMLDAAASVAADAGLDFLMQDAARMLRPFERIVQDHRFSPGYGDCSIEYQKTLLDILHDQPLGVELTESFMLIPEKSVLAIGGVRHV